MNNLSYELIVDNISRRKIDVIHLLYKTPLSVNALAAECHVSRKTMLHTLSELVFDLPKGIRIEINENDIVFLEIKNFFSMIDFEKKLLQDSPLYFVIDYTFKNIDFSVTDISKKTFLSSSTVRKHLNHLSVVLKKYHLKLSINPIEIQGDEINLRYFYFQYFRYANGTFLFSQNNVPLNKLHSAMRMSSKGSYISLALDYYKSAYWLMIMKTRIEEGSYIEVPQDIIDYHRSKKSYENFKKVFITSFEDDKILSNLSENELVYAYCTRLDSVLYEEKNSHFMDDYYDELKRYENLVDQFFQAYELSRVSNNELRVLLLSYLCNTAILSKLTPLHQMVDINLYTEASLNYPAIYHIWFDLFSTEDSFIYKEDIAASLSTLSVTYLQKYKQKEKKLLFALSGEVSSLSYYKNLIEQFLPKHNKPRFIFNKPITNELLDSLEIDRLICNFSPPHEITSCPTIRISDIPYDKELVWLVTHLFEN